MYIYLPISLSISLIMIASHSLHQLDEVDDSDELDRHRRHKMRHGKGKAEEPGAELGREGRRGSFALQVPRQQQRRVAERLCDARLEQETHWLRPSRSLTALRLQRAPASRTPCRPAQRRGRGTAGARSTARPERRAPSPGPPDRATRTGVHCTR